MIRINLLPPEYASAQARKEQQLLAASAGTVIVTLLALVWMVQSRKAAALEVKINEAQTELNKFQAIVSQIERIEADKRALSSKRDVIRNLNRSRLIYPVYFEDLLPIIPSDVWIQNMQIVEQGSQLKVTMSANALSNFALATWMTNLQQSNHFTQIELDPISYSTGEAGSQILTFTIRCLYQHQGPFPLSEFN